MNFSSKCVNPSMNIAHTLSQQKFESRHKNPSLSRLMEMQRYMSGFLTRYSNVYMYVNKGQTHCINVLYSVYYCIPSMLQPWQAVSCGYSDYFWYRPGSGGIFLNRLFNIHQSHNSSEENHVTDHFAFGNRQILKIR